MNSEKIISVSVLTGPLKDQKVFVRPGSPVLIGRGDEAAIKIAYDDYCSRMHALIYREADLCFIEDLNSVNGTLLNNILIHGKKELKDKDIIALGDTKLIVLLNDSLNEPKKKESATPDLATKIKAGDSIYGRYEVYHVLDAGMGIACACYDNINRAPYVLKTLQRKFLVPSQSQAFFEKEALAWIGLGKYPYIVSAYVVIRIENYPFVVIDYIAPDENGRNTLSHYLDNLTFPEALKYSIEFCYGMEYAYAKEIKAHGNIKPNNIMITPDKTVKITDFGFAKLSQEIEFNEHIPENKDSDLSIFKGVGGVRSGTLAYMAPEQFDGQINQVSDIYSFGVVLYQMAKCGALPFTGRNPLEYEKSHKDGTVPYLDSPLFAIISKCLEKDPNKRYANFAALRTDLQELFLKETGKKITPLEGTKLEAWEILNKGVSLYSLGKHENGLACYDKAIAINPEYADAYYSRGNAYYDKESLEQAIADYSKAIEINPVYLKAYYNRGVFYYKKGNLVQAISDYNKAIAINPEYADAYYSRGKAYYDKGNLAQAVSDYSRVIEINPVYPKVYCNRGSVYYDKGDLELAISDYNKAIEIDPQYAEAYNNRGIAYHKKGKLELAISDYSRAIEINPQYAEAYNDRGIAYYKKGNLEQAIFDYSKAIENNPKDAEVYNNRGIAYHKKGKLELAISDYSRAIEINPAYSKAYCNRGSVYHDKDDLVQAISDYSKAIENNPRDAEIYNSRGITYHVRGKLELAISDYSKAIEINPAYSKAYCNRGSVYYDKGDLELAISDYSKAIEINPAYSKAYCNRGTVYLLKKDYDKSWKDVHKAEELGYKIPLNLINDLKRASGRGA